MFHNVSELEATTHTAQANSIRLITLLHIWGDAVQLTETNFHYKLQRLNDYSSRKILTQIKSLKLSNSESSCFV